MAVAANILALLTVSVWTVARTDAAEPGGGTPPPQPPTSAPEAEEVQRSPSTAAQERPPDPRRIRVASTNIDSELVRLGKEGDGSLQVPSDPSTAGWWAGGAKPGEQGPAVIVGHVDSRDGPGIFFGLGDVEEGDTATVEREDGAAVVYRVARVEAHPKDDFPTEAVYGHTDEATLRLITCSGAFNREERSYEDNTIVFLDQAGKEGFDGRQPVRWSDPGPSAVDDRPASTPTSERQSSEPGDQPGVPIAAAMLSLLGTGGSVVRHLVTRR